MKQFLPLSLFLSLSIPTLAQQPDTLAPRRVGVVVANSSLPAVQHTLSIDTLYHKIKGIPIQPYHFTPFFPIQEQLRQVAGVQATPYSGAPGAQVAVRIRGAASFSRNAQPLYVVDGVPVWQHHTVRLGPQYNVVSSYELNPLLSLPTQDIASVEVVKGAYETAEYGAQGQNGVIRITTRTGQAGKPRVSYTGYAGVQQARFRHNLLDVQEYAALANEEMALYGLSPRYTQAQIAAFGQGTDWQQEVLRTASVHQQQVALQGGSTRTTYYTSAAYRQQQGIVQNSRLRTLSLRASATHSFTPSLTLRGTVTASEQQARLPAQDLIVGMLLAPPTQPTHTPDSKLAETDYQDGNPLRHALLSYRTPRQRYALTQLQLRYTVLPSLTLELQGAQEYIQQQMSTYEASQLIGNTPGGLTREQQATYRQWSAQPALRFKHTWAQRHQVQVGLQGQYQRQQQQLQRTSYQSPSEPPSSSERFPFSFTSYQLTSSYRYRERYEAAATLRRDAARTSAGTSLLAPPLAQYLPGVQLKWHARQEPWLPLMPFISTLDAWVGWGSTTNAGNFAAVNTLLYNVSAANGFFTQAVPLHEHTRQRDVGLTVGLWQNRLLLTSTTYHRLTKVNGLLPNILRPQETPDRRSYGQIRNQGWELSATAQWQLGRLQATSALSAAFNRNRYVADELTAILLGNNQWTRDGQPLAAFYASRYEGADATGYPRYQDVDGNGTIDSRDNQMVGSGLPRQLLSFSQTFELGRFRLQAQADGMFGYRVNTPYLRFLGTPNAFTNSTRETLTHWTPDNPAARLPRAGMTVSEGSDFTLQSGNHVRLSALNVGYKVWEKAGRSAHLWLGGQNLLVLTRYRGFDPNVSSAGSDNQQAGLDAGAYPVARTLLLGVRATL